MLKNLLLWSISISIVPVLPFFVSVSCPEICFCDIFSADCKYNELKKLPSGLDLNITDLDLAYNDFEEFPSNLKIFTNLKSLNFSHNKLSILGYLAMDGLSNLERVDFSNNKFYDWIDIKTTTFYATTKLTYLDFSHNPLGNFPVLKLKSLEVLKLNNCSIKTFNGNIFYTLPNLKKLHIAQNPIIIINSTFQSRTLKFLDLSQCNLKYINDWSIYNLTSLEEIWLYKNINLKKFNCISNSMIFLDLSYCNLETIPTNHLKQVSTVNFHGNHFRIIPKYSFRNFTNLKSLDLSNNAISIIEEKAFNDLLEIQVIDLSFNTLTSLNKFIFTSNDQLKKLNLSHNYFSKVEKFVSDSLEILDMSSCEIHTLTSDNLIDITSLKILNLSKNILSFIPDYIESPTLTKMDLSFCHIKSLNNKTFLSMQSLREINLSGNRLTQVDPSYFNQIINLDISDNPWRCDCRKLKAMYTWLQQTGKNLDKLVCQSPEKFEGLSWLNACKNDWYPEMHGKDTIWWYSVALIVTMLLILLAIIITRRIITIKERRLQQQEESRRAEERECLRRMRRMQLEAREEASRNAPDPRELERPPAYNEAILLPRLDSSHPSLSGSLHSIASKYSVHGSNPEIQKKHRVRRKRRRRKSETSVESPRISQNVADDTDNSDTEIIDRPQTDAVRRTMESDF